MLLPNVFLGMDLVIEEPLALPQPEQLLKLFVDEKSKTGELGVGVGNHPSP